MHSKKLIELVKELFASGQTVGIISKNLRITYTTIDYIFKNNYNRNKLRSEPKKKLNSHHETKIKKEIATLKKEMKESWRQN